MIIEELKQEDSFKVNQMLGKYFFHLQNKDVADWEWCKPPLCSTRFVAKIGDLHVAHYGLMGYDMNFFGKKIEGGKLEGAYVDLDRLFVQLRKKRVAGKKVRNKDVFRELIFAMLAYLRSRGEIFVFGIVNQKSKKAQVQCGYESLAIPYVQMIKVKSSFSYVSDMIRKSRWYRYRSVRKLIIVLSIMLYFRFILRWIIASGVGCISRKGETGATMIRKVLIEEVDDNIFSRINSKNHVGVFRSRAFYDWRYKQNPSVEANFYILSFENEFKGFCVITENEKEICLDDFCFVEHCDGMIFVTQIVNELKNIKGKRKSIRIDFQQDFRKERLIKEFSRRLGFCILKPSRYSIIYYSRTDDARLQNGMNWDITGACKEGVS